MDMAKSMAKASEVETSKAIVERYLCLHGEGAYTYRPFVRQGIYRRKDYRYHADLNSLQPDAALGAYSYIWGTYETSTSMNLRFALIPYGPVKIYVNGTLCGKSDIFSERYRSKQIFELPMEKGTNDLVLLCENTSGGFGCEFGTWVGKLDYYFMMPSLYTSQEGCCYSKASLTLLDEITIDELRMLEWLPERFSLTPGELDLRQVFPQAELDSYAVVVTSFAVEKDMWCSFACNAELFLDGEPVMQESLEIQKGEHVISMYAKIGEVLNLSLKNAKTQEDLECFHPLLSKEGPYRYVMAGPFASRPEGFEIQYHASFKTDAGLDFYHLEGKETYLRIYNDNPLFGHWNYPLGVTLYGLVETERMLKERDEELAMQIHRYLERHVQASLDLFEYALWDKQTLGGATAVHHLMTSLDSLDDCGSFASTVLEIAKDHAIENHERIIKVVGDYISLQQPRLSDGTFFRTGLMHDFHENTMWVDDLYMSVPFLCRYADLTKESRYLDDAAHQFLGFAHYLYMKDIQMMSHVYDFNRTIATGIPWGRGNGWAIFSLSELLQRLAHDHPLYAHLLALFRDLSEGYLKVQGENGMFHQVLTLSSSYEESSCTAMFACSFSRGVYNGWYVDPLPFSASAKQAWKALKAHAIDQDGHVWGVCRGSEFSCSPHYYANELLPRLDDTHGIGIVLLAGCEYEKLLAFENKEE